MIEFKRCPASRAYRLIEVNGRLWGSLALCVAAGADFPAMLYQLHVHGQLEPQPEYRRGVYCRKLSLDLHWLELVARRLAPAQIVEVPPLGSALKDFLRIFSRDHHFDVQALSDPVPGVVDLWRILRQYSARLFALAADRVVVEGQRLAWRTGFVRRRLQGTGRIVFICHGNINRSILAERYLSMRRPDLAGRVRSAGFHQVGGRPADPSMVALARGRGVDLSACASTVAGREFFQESDVVFVMDLQQLRRIRALRPDLAGCSFLLALAACPQPSIADPYAQPPSAYEACFGQVTACVDRICEMIAPGLAQPDSERIATKQYGDTR